MSKVENHSRLDILIAELGVAEKAASNASDQVEAIRKEIFGIVENEGLVEGYKNSQATVSYVTRKKVEFVNPESLMEEVKQQNIVRYFKTIPEHTEFTKELEKDLKDGVYKSESANIEVSQGLAIKFNK